MTDERDCSVMDPCHDCDYCREYYNWLFNSPDWFEDDARSSDNGDRIEL